MVPLDVPKLKRIINFTYFYISIKHSIIVIYIRERCSSNTSLYFDIVDENNQIKKHEVTDIRIAISLHRV